MAENRPFSPESERFAPLPGAFRPVIRIIVEPRSMPDLPRFGMLLQKDSCPKPLNDVGLTKARERRHSHVYATKNRARV